MDQATKLLYLKPETLKNQLKSHLFELVKHKREKYRNEIRTTRLSSELNLKRFKICQNSNSSFNCTNHSLDVIKL